MNLTDAEQAANLCDDTAFTRGLPNIKSIIEGPSMMAGILIHPGMDESAASSGDEKHRVNTCPTQEEWVAMRAKAKEKQRSGAAELLPTVTSLTLIGERWPSCDAPVSHAC